MVGEEGMAPQSSAGTARPNRLDLSGTTFGKYRLVEKLGQGGMAQVYRAYQPDLERFVAVKLLHPYLTADQEFTARFRREAQAIATLEHPHIVRVYDFDTSDHGAFLVMECLDGQGLDERLRTLSQSGERMPLDQVVALVGALADALDFAHSRGIVHRDVKPANVLLTAGGRPVLTDFGIARSMEATAVTTSGEMLGTPAYMSPEQGRGQAGDARSDIYALGVLAYQLCTGRLPFEADTPYAVILKHITEPLTPPRSLRPDLPPGVETVIVKVLAKNPDERFQTAGELAGALRGAVAEGAAPSHRRVTNVLVPFKIARPAVIVALLVAAVLVLLLVTRPMRVERLLSQIAPGLAAAERNTLVFYGPGIVEDTWLDPDSPDEAWFAADTVHLQGPAKPDRILLAFMLTRLPPESTVVSATLTLRAERYGSEPRAAKISVHRVLTPWRATAATYNSPWSTPGLAPDRDYEQTPLDVQAMPAAGWVALDVTRAVSTWQSRGRIGGGLVVMLTPDSDPLSHYWVSMSEQTDPANCPTLRVRYEVNR